MRSTIGGTLRLRSYVELEGDGLREAEGDCPNPLFAPAQIKEPLLSKSLSTKPKLSVKKVYEYDLTTVPGGEYRVYLKGTQDGIADHELSRNVHDDIYYDLQGRPVAQPKKGIYIVNGKKVYVND